MREYFGVAMPPYEPYLDFLARIHVLLQPRAYVEIGMSHGDSLALALATTLVVGIDPAVALRREVNRNARLFFETSDEFFTHHDLERVLQGLPLDLAFIDGMHLGEQALRDFQNLERCAGSDSVILVHDTNPPDSVSASRTRSSGHWAGDVWKFVLCLREFRPDLSVTTIDVPPTGLSIVTGLNPSSTALVELEAKVSQRLCELDYSVLQEDREVLLNLVPND